MLPAMSDASTVDDLLACPRCDRAPLTAGDGEYRCAACRTEFGTIGGIPWLFADPESSLGEWQNRLHYELERLAREAKSLSGELQAVTDERKARAGEEKALAAEAKGERLQAITRRRLERRLEAVEAHRRALRQLLAPLGVQSREGSFESHLALRTRLPLDQGLNTYYANVHRDWCWGAAENDASLAQIRSVAGASGKLAGGPGAAAAGELGDVPGSGELGDVLVLGAGACRLAYDLHRELGARRTVALDFNPLLLRVADAVVRGRSLELYEFPIAPKSLEDVAVLRTLAAPEPISDGFFLVLGDVLRAPFRPAAFDTVVTPWLIDIVTENLPVFAARLNRLLRQDGRWINFGSLAFDRPEHAERYGPEEVLAITAEAGFGKPAVEEAVIPYMCSPASRHGRQERVFTFSAAKMEDVPAPPRHKALPDWIVTGKKPVPPLPSFRTQAMTTRIYAYVMSLIDGRRTLEDMAALMERERLMTRAEAIPAIRGFLTRMYDDSKRGL